VLIFIFLSAVMGVHPRVGIPTSIVTMALISIAGFVIFGIIGGQLGTMLNSDGFVVATRTQDMSFPLEPERFDVFGIWLGAVPVVALAAPLGAYWASIVSEKVLIGFVVSIGIAEVISTVFFLDALRTSVALAAFLVVGLFGAFGMTRLLARAHTWVMGPDSDQSTPLPETG